MIRGLMSKKQEDDKKTVFDGGTFGIGHNQGPPLDDREVIAAEADANADTDTRLVKRGRKRRRVSGSKLTPEALVWLRAKEKSGELEKVTWDSPYGSDVVENFEGGGRGRLSTAGQVNGATLTA